MFRQIETSQRAGVLPCALLLLSLSGCGGGGGGGGGAGAAPVDTTPPDTTITSGPAAYTELNTATFTFTSSEPNSIFRVSIDASPFVVATSPHTITGLSNGFHSFAVSASDTVGNIDASAAIQTWTVSPIPETTFVTKPATLSNSRFATLTFASSVSNSTFEYSLDGAPFVAASSSAPDLGSLSEGSHQLSVRAIVGGLLIDPTPATTAWIVDVTPPTATILFPSTPTSYTDASTLTVRGIAADLHGLTAVRVNGVVAQSATAFNSWQATVPVGIGNSGITVSATDGAGNVMQIADTALVTTGGPPFANLRAMAVDAAHNNILAADLSLMAVVAIKLDSGATSILSDKTHGTGPAFEGIEGILIDGNRALVLDWVLDDIIAVDLATGARTSLSPTSTATTEFNIGGIAVDWPNSIAYVTNAATASVIAVDLSTGARTVVSSGAVGAGPALGNPLDIVFDGTSTPHRLLVVDSTVQGVVAVAIGNGNRAVLSSAPPTGSGIAFESPLRMRHDVANNRLLVTEGALNKQGVVAVDLATGNRTVIASPSVGTGRALAYPMAIAANPSGTRAFVAGNPGTEVIAIDVQTRARTVHSSTNVGSGIQPIDQRGLAVVGSSVFFLDSTRGTLNRFDLATGERTLLSGAGSGSGPVLTTPQHQVFDAASQRLYVVDSGTDSILSIDANTGARTLVSGNGAGSGTAFGFPRGIALDPTANRALVTDSGLAAVLSVDLSTGARTLIAGPGVGGGTAFNIPQHIAIDRVTNASAPRALISNMAPAGILSANLLNGNRASFSTASPIGSGTHFLLPTALWLDSAGQRLLVLDTSHENLMSVSLSNASRQIISGRNSVDESITGNGPRLAFPWSLTADPATGIAYVADSDLLAIFAIDLATGERIIVSR